jgi:hypothetical protein
VVLRMVVGLVLTAAAPGLGRSGPSAAIFPMVYHDLVRWIEERGYRAAAGPGREVWVNEVDDVADVVQQVSEVQLPFGWRARQSAA